MASTSATLHSTGSHAMGVAPSMRSSKGAPTRARTAPAPSKRSRVLSMVFR